VYSAALRSILMMSSAFLAMGAFGYSMMLQKSNNTGMQIQRIVSELSHGVATSHSLEASVRNEKNIFLPVASVRSWPISALRERRLRIDNDLARWATTSGKGTLRLRDVIRPAECSMPEINRAHSPQSLYGLIVREHTIIGNC
jgi:hypothetical protein